MNLRRTISRFRRNPKALAVLFVSLACVTIASVIGKPDLTLFASAMIGAAVSSGVAFIISFIETSDEYKIPNHLIDAAKREIRLTGFYREYQDVHVEYLANRLGKSNLDAIRLSFESKVVPIGDRPITLRYPKVKAPSGLTCLRQQYSIDSENISDGSDKEISGSAHEKLVVEYEITDREKAEYLDEHIWLAPVLDYEVYFKLPPSFSCEVLELVGDKNLQISRSPRQRAGEIRYTQQHSAFSRQGFRWKIFKPA